MTHQRTAFAARKTANIGAASQRIKGRRRRITSSAAPISTAVCSSTIQRNFGSSTFAAPRATISLWCRLEMRNSASRKNATARSRPRNAVTLRPIAIAENPRCCQGVCTGLERSFFHPLLQNEKDRRAGEISHVSENVPGWLGVALAQTKLRLDVSEQPRSTRMQNPAFDLLALPAVAIEEALYQPADPCPDHFRNVFCQQDVESGIA